MISKAYEKADFQIIEFTLEDVLTFSSVVHTTTEPSTTLPTTVPGTTVPPTTVPGTTQTITIGGGSGDAIFDYSDLFQ